MFFEHDVDKACPKASNCLVFECFLHLGVRYMDPTNVRKQAMISLQRMADERLSREYYFFVFFQILLDDPFS